MPCNGSKSRRGAFCWTYALDHTSKRLEPIARLRTLLVRAERTHVLNPGVGANISTHVLKLGVAGIERVFYSLMSKYSVGKRKGLVMSESFCAGMVGVLCDSIAPEKHANRHLCVIVLSGA